MREHKKKIKDKKKNRKKKIKKYREQINNHKNELWIPNLDVNYQDLKINSCFTIKEYINDEVSEMNKGNLKFKAEKKLFRNKKIYIFPTDEQSRILQLWFDTFIAMYNATVKFIRQNQKRIGVSIFNWKNLRTTHLKEIRDCYKEGSKLNNNSPEIYTHLLDEAIKLCCTSFKSAFTNLRRGHIKHFLIKYMKFNKDTKILKLEKELFKGTRNIFTNLKAKTEDGKDFNPQRIYTEFKVTTILCYDMISKKYFLMVPERIDREDNNNEKKILSGDLGLRTFLTGITENEVIKFGDEFGKKIKKRLLRIDKIKTLPVSNKRKKKVQKTQNLKIKNMVTELHCKTINYLVNKYQTILIGNLSVKGIVSKKTSVLNKMTKRIGLSLAFYKFKQRLKNKCQTKNVIYQEIDESYTSKICSNCGYYKKNLGGNKIYNCNKCHIIIDRDVGGARGIYLKSK